MKSEQVRQQAIAFALPMSVYRLVTISKVWAKVNL